MKLTQETDYALRLVGFFASHENAGYMPAREISGNQGIPFRFLLRVINKLKRAGILASRQGVGGGYLLAKPPAAISLRAVIEAIEGPMNISRCLKDTALCNVGFAPECKVHQALGRVQENLLADLGRRNFENIRDCPPAVDT